MLQLMPEVADAKMLVKPKMARHGYKALGPGVSSLSQR